MQTSLIFPSFSEIFKLLAHCGIATVNCSVKLPIVSAHQIIAIRETEHGAEGGERGMCATFQWELSGSGQYRDQLSYLVVRQSVLGCSPAFNLSPKT